MDKARDQLVAADWPVSVTEAAALLDRRSRRSWHRGLAVRSWGEGPSVLLVHGGVGSWSHWVRNVGPLAEHFTVHALDLPGFGDSPDAPPGLGPDGYLDWVAETAKDLALCSTGGSTGLIGFSFGGVVAAAVAGRIGACVRRLSLIGPGGFGEPVGRSIPVRKRPSDRSDLQLMREVTAYNLGQWMLSAPPATDDAVIDLHMANVERARFDSRTVGWRPTLLSDLQRATAPVQVLWGDSDRLAHPSVEARRAMCLAARADIETAVVAGCGHWSQYMCAGPINRLLLDFQARGTSPD